MDQQDAANQSMSILSGRDHGTTPVPLGGAKPINYEERCKELQAEIDNMHELISEKHGHDSVLASYVEQIKEKDKLLLERDAKLSELTDRANLL